MTRPKKILLVNEDSRISTGYAVHGAALLKRWHAAGYDVAELSIYTPPGPITVPWKVYSNNPTNKHEEEVYNSMPGVAEFGFWKFEQVCLDFQPDVVTSVRDNYMSFEHESPFFDIFHFIFQPTYDSYPSHEDWVAQYDKADELFTFSQFAQDNLIRQLPTAKNKVRGIAPICVETDIFRPLNKKQIRLELGLPQDALVIGTVMRNQKRKLFPDLIEAFHKLVRHARANGRDDIANKLYLHLHCFYPDLGWDIPRKLREFGGNRVVFTYHCQQCKRLKALNFSNSSDWCECGGLMEMPGVGNGVSREQLALIYNNFDIYTQYVTSGGSEIGQLEACSCGIRCISTNYSAMKSFVENTDSIPLDVLMYQPQAETGVYWGYPSQEDFVEKVFVFLSQPENMRNHQAMQSREKFLSCYNWDKTAKMWMDAFDEAPEANWKQPLKFYNRIPHQLPSQLLDEKGLNLLHFVDYVIQFYPHTEFERLSMLKNLLQGFTIQGRGYQVCEDTLMMARAPRHPYGIETVVNDINAKIDKHNAWEQRRKEKFGL